jgi:pyridoxal/pyridoxine/pyridoxamine kinase
MLTSFLGYIGSKSFLEKVGDIIKDMKKTNPDLTYGE